MSNNNRSTNGRNNQRQKPVYDIEMTRYVYTPTGEVTPNGGLVRYRDGQPQKKIIKNTNFGNLKRDLYNRTVDRNDVYVNYSAPQYRIIEQKKRLRSVVQTLPDGTQIRTFYNAVKR